MRKMKILLLLIIGILIGVILFVYPYETEETLTGTGSWNVGDTYDFSSQAVYRNENKIGDIFLVPQGGGEVGIPERRAELSKIKAIAIYDGGFNSSFDCKHIIYDQQQLAIILLDSGEIYKSNRTICIITEEGDYAKMTFTYGFANFDWTIYKKQLHYGLLSSVSAFQYIISESTIDPTIISELQFKEAYNQTFYEYHSGCGGNAFSISKYDKGEWVEFPGGCGFCALSIVELELESNKTKDFQWDQYLYIPDPNCGTKKADAGLYRIRMDSTTSTPTITSYSLPFQISS